MGSILISHLHLPPTPEEFLNNDLLQLLDPSQDPATGVVVELTPPPTRYPNCPPAFPFEAPPSAVVPPWSWRSLWDPPGALSWEWMEIRCPEFLHVFSRGILQDAKDANQKRQQCQIPQTTHKKCVVHIKIHLKI